MTEKERLDRETLLKRAAAVAGAVYLAPVLTSAAAAEAQECPTFLCKTKKRRKKCRRFPPGKGQTCDCQVGERCGCTTCDPVCWTECPRNDPNPCTPPLGCPGCAGSGACFQCANDISNGTCVDLRDGLCASFSPCGEGNTCPLGQACFNSCCGTPLCSDACTGDAAPVARSVRPDGPGMLYASP